eukprot:scaffold19754_cov137-Isochrysis_galbana.AAC.6
MPGWRAGAGGRRGETASCEAPTASMTASAGLGRGRRSAKVPDERSGIGREEQLVQVYQRRVRAGRLAARCGAAQAGQRSQAGCVAVCQPDSQGGRVPGAQQNHVGAGEQGGRVGSAQRRLAHLDGQRGHCAPQCITSGARAAVWHACWRGGGVARTRRDGQSGGVDQAEAGDAASAEEGSRVRPNGSDAHDDHERAADRSLSLLAQKVEVARDLLAEQLVGLRAKRRIACRQEFGLAQYGRGAGARVEAPQGQRAGDGRHGPGGSRSGARRGRRPETAGRCEEARTCDDGGGWCRARRLNTSPARWMRCNRRHGHLRARACVQHPLILAGSGYVCACSAGTCPARAGLWAEFWSRQPVALFVGASAQPCTTLLEAGIDRLAMALAQRSS